MAKSFGTHEPFYVELPRLVHQHATSFRAVARAAELDPSYLHQVVKGNRAPSEKLLLGAAEHFELPPEYFREYRELRVLEELRANPAVLDRVYRLVVRDS